MKDVDNHLQVDHTDSTLLPVLVCIGHCRDNLLVPYNHVQYQSVLEQYLPCIRVGQSGNSCIYAILWFYVGAVLSACYAIL